MSNMCSCLIADWDPKCPAHGTDSKMMKQWTKEVMKAHGIDSNIMEKWAKEVREDKIANRKLEAKE